MDWEGHAKKQQNPNPLEQWLQDFLNNTGGLLTVLAIVVVGFCAINSIYTVETDENAVVTFLGRYQETTGPGLHVKWPLLNQITKVKTTVVHEESFGFSLPGGNARHQRLVRNSDEESLMLTGDLNVADVEWVVQYRIVDPHDYLFHVRDPIKNIRDVSQATMRRVVGDRTVTNVLTVGRIDIASEVKRLSQKILDNYRMGIQILDVKLQDVNPPEKVKPYFDLVNAAKQEQEQGINEAEAERNKVIPEAKGKAQQAITEAQGKALEIKNRAEGDARKFSQLFEEYRKAPKITKTRLYLELVEDVLRRTPSLTVVDPEVKGLLPIFSEGPSMRAQLRRDANSAPERSVPEGGEQ